MDVIDRPLTILEAVLTTTTMFFGLLLNAFIISSLTQVIPHLPSHLPLPPRNLPELLNALIISSPTQPLAQLSSPLWCALLP